MPGIWLAMPVALLPHRGLLQLCVVFELLFGLILIQIDPILICVLQRPHLRGVRLVESYRLSGVVPNGSKRMTKFCSVYHPLVEAEQQWQTWAALKGRLILRVD